MKLIVLLLLLGVGGGCSYTHVLTLAGQDAQRLNIQAAERLRVAVVLADVPEEVTTRIAMHTFRVVNMREIVERIIYTSLAETVDTVRFFERDVPPGFDLHLYPAASFMVDRDYRCNVKEKLKVTDGRDRPLAVKDAQSSSAKIGQLYFCSGSAATAFSDAAKDALTVAVQSLAASAAPPPTVSLAPAAKVEALPAATPKRQRRKQ
jgi:hypothetical protein